MVAAERYSEMWMDRDTPHYSADGRWWWDGATWVPVVEQPGRPSGRRGRSLWLTVGASALILALCLGTLAVAAVVLPSRIVGRAQESGTGPGNLQACSLDNFDQDRNVCRSNQATQGLHGQALMCSATLRGSVGDRSTARITYRKHVVASDHLDMQEAVSPVRYGYTLGPNDLPGGPWACEFSVHGQTQRLAIQVKGPTSSFLYPMACDAQQGVQIGSSTTCTQNQATVQKPPAILCSALVTDAQNKDVRVDVLSQGGSGPPVAQSAKKPQDEFYLASVGLDATQLGAGATAVPPGAYVCRWSVNQKTVGQAAFQVQ